MTWFSLGRSEGFPTQYDPHHTPVTVDVLEAGFICAFLILVVCFFISLPSPRLKNNAYLFIRISVSLLIGLFIMLSNFGQEWEVGHILTKTPYRVGTGHEINASIGIKIGLRSVNVTLKSDHEAGSPLENEIINYNERFEWTWDQGRFGFGPYAGHLQQQFREAQYKGLPLPILWIVDYFVIDGEGFRYGRFYRTAGWYTHILIWTAFPCWLLANILFRSVIRYGAFYLGICGGLMILGNIIWSSIRNPNPLVIPFENAIITTKLGFSYWLTLVTGIVCVILSIVILICEAKYDTAVSIFFGIDPLTCFDEYVLTQKELEVLRKKDGGKDNMMSLSEMGASTSTADTQPVEPSVTQTVYLKRKSTIHIGKAVPKIRRILPPKDDEQPLYGNMETIREYESRQDRSVLS
ncbi:hypothetical protein ILUMI_27016 [Ignelater luminosus]|uniref:Dual oxidase maturation factor 1 n=1 Tax=Ignelater luminosus TaxID=2038154 RepID=A0A8K0FYL2_IGNLU|nr:hypothetical protein ILUMI_27016 [Ignelater luminosus]